MDAGGLAQMTYNNFSAGALGAPGAGFAAREKGSNNFKRLSVAVQPKVGSINENSAEANPTPRTSRSHLLAGLRTAPKTPNAPASAPSNQTEQPFGLAASKHADKNHGHNVPQTAAIGNGFSGMNVNGFGAQQMLGHPHVLAPPELQYGSPEEMDPDQLATLLQTQLYLAKRQQQLQQQLSDLQQLQFQGYNGNSTPLSNQLPATPVTPSTLYQQQLQNGLSPVTQEIPGQPGLHLVFNPMTGQYSYVMDHNTAQQRSPPTEESNPLASPNAKPPVASFRGPMSPPSSRSITPPKSATPPQVQVEVEPLPPPSANAFRPSQHKKVASWNINPALANATPDAGLRSGVARQPATPVTGTFGPGQARAGEHPVRQPRGPPSFDELAAAPTAKHDGSKNFATRQRRRALHSLVKAGIERNRNGRGSVGGASGSDALGAGTPSSEISEPLFGGSEPDDDDIGRRNSGGALSVRPSAAGLRTPSAGAIGSEMKERSRERLEKRHAGSMF